MILGFGRFLVSRAKDILTQDEFEPSRRLCDLGPYDHLARLIRLCIVHFKRNVKKLQHHVSPEVLQAMYSLATSQPLGNFKDVETVIKGGGKKAKGRSNGFIWPQWTDRHSRLVYGQDCRFAFRVAGPVSAQKQDSSRAMACRSINNKWYRTNTS